MNSNSTKTSSASVTFLRASMLSAMMLLLLFANSLQAQLVYNESFDFPSPTTTLPLGWSQGKVGAGSDPDNYWDRVTFGTDPVAAPMGTAMMRYLSFYTVATEASFLASKRFDMNNGMPGGGAPFSFKFWRDNTGAYSATPDKIEVYVNTTPNMAGTPLLLTETITLSNVIHRSNALAPITATNGFVTYNYIIPQAGYNIAGVYVVIVATSADGNNIFLDDFSMTSYPAVQTFAGPAAATVVVQNSFNTGVSQLNQEIIGCKITMAGALTPRTLTAMEFNTNGSTSPNPDIGAAKLYYTGGNSQFNMATAQLMGTYTAPWATNYIFLTVVGGPYAGLTSFSGLETGDNYFWILYDIPAGGTPGNFVDAEWFSLNMSGSGAVIPSVQTLPGNRLIDVLYCIPTLTLGTSWASYNANDYVREVHVTGGSLPNLDNTKNWMLSNPSASASEGCNVGPYPKDCYYQNHGPDYELFAESGHPGYTVGRSTSKSFIADGTTSYTISLTCGTWFSANYMAAFIDFNKDGDFIDAGEKICQSSSMAALSTQTFNFTIPLTATPGKTRLRVREVYATSNISSCGSGTWGETEDYVITIIPDCPGFPGYTTWLGLTNNWADPSNWCPAIAPVSPNPFVNVRLPGVPAGPYTYVRPIIKANVTARANKLRIEANDTLYIDATTNSSLTIQDSVKIWTPTSAFKVNTTLIDTAQVQNGTLNRPTDNPLTSARRARSFLAFTQADLLGQGLITGDVITNIFIHLQRKSNGNPYKNFTLKYYYASTAPFGTGSTAVIPVPIGPPATTIYAGDLDIDAWVPGANAFGTVDLLLTTPIIWSGTANNLIVEMCYDNVGFAATTTTDEIRFTQTTSLRRYLKMQELSTFPKAGCALTPQDTVWLTVTGTSGTPTLTVVDPAAAAKIYPGQLAVGGGVSGLQVVSIVGTTITMSANAFANTTIASQVNFFNVQTIGIFYRPNLTFKFSRPYIKYPISVGGHWENNGTFVPAVSRVTMNGTIANQKVDGTISTTFYDLNIQNSNHVMRMRDFTVTDSLRLVSGRLKLNNGLVTLTNQLPSALTYVLNVGDIQAETDVIANNVSPYGRISWNMGSTVGMRIIPFINSSGVRIPMDYNIDAGTHNVIIGTYSTLQDNTNLPAPEVTNILGVNNAIGGGWGTGGWSMADRYYFIDNTAGITPQADITFRYAPLEQAQSGNVGMVAQRWIPTTDLWEFPFQPGQLFTAGAPNSVVVPNYTGFDVSSWWTIVGNSTPLPVSLLEFKAEQHKDKVKLFWSTASEINNSHFEIERTVNNTDFEFIGRAESKGPGTNVQDYFVWDNNPVEGTQYYYLRQFDYNGKMERFGPVSAKFSNEEFEIVTTTVSSTDAGLTVVFNYNSSEPYSYRIMDMTGRIIVAKDRNAAVDGLNVIDIDASLAKGAYHIVLQNSSKVVSRKFFY